MSAQFSTHKRLLSRYCSKLESVIARYKDENLETVKLSTEVPAPTFLRESRRRLEEAIGAIETCSTRIQQQVREYATTVDTCEQVSEKERTDFDEYASKAEAVLCSSLDYTVLLEARLNAFKSYDRAPLHPMKETSSTAVDGTIESRRLELPTLPIPTFNGDVWDWDNFWTLFDTNVNSQPMPELFKFNYLLNALKGEPFHAVKKFRVSSDNYRKAVDFLRNKYGDIEELVNQLYDRLEKLQLSTSSVKEQRILLEHIQVIIAQLRDKKEQVDNQCIVKQVLSKFPNKLQRKVLERKYLHKGDSFDMETLLKLLEDFITTEEKVLLFTKEVTTAQESSPPKKKAEAFKRVCMYCKEEHKSMVCTKYRTPQARSQYLRDHRLCFICASPRHTTAECKKRMCFICQGAHHTSCCFKSAPDGTSHVPSTQQQKQKTQNGTRNFQARQHTPIPSPVSNVHQVTEHAEEDEVAICELHTTRETYKEKNTYLPTGIIQVMDPNTGNLRKIAVLLDTGAELSFIDKKLVEELHLPTLETTKLRLRTFGSEQVKENFCDKVKLEAWDVDGKQFAVDLLKYDVISKSFETPSLSSEDIAHLRAKQIPFEKPGSKRIMKPQILLGCDKLWSFLKENKPHISLPSGLHLIESRLGYLISGQSRPSSRIVGLDEVDKWDGYWTLEAQINTISIMDDGDQEQERWDKVWSLEAAGTERFCHSEDIERALEDKAVLQRFRETIEKREDGYYVRLPWKEHIMDLPDNKAIAQRRLASLWSSLRKDPNLLHQYDEVFQDQLSRNILEHVPHEEKEHKHIHFLPHQAVITPHKTTTKLRIVYDASAHYRNSLSLNDALHRGPVILPQLYGILLRFRIGRIAMISDVEKAFLQVRLHEEDRDATRCLWLRDCTAPPTQDNIVMLRFTRVPFGLNASPFLLAATTHYHLDQYKEDYRMIQEIKDNLYVDNLIVTVDTVEEASTCYRKIKHMFEELSMNLREFVINEEQARNRITSSDRSSESAPKVLGVRWNSLNDRLEVSCSISSPKELTKRAVTSAIASIYDPMGWMLPLVHKSKVFLQSLWKEKVEWDTPLAEDHLQEWQQICDNMQGFRKEIPRFITKKHAKVDLAAFADASAEALAMCVYLKSESATHLLLARGKLPSIRYEATIPKKELNAATLAIRVVNSVVTQLQTIVAVQRIYLFSDSEIVYHWIKNKPLRDAGVMVFNRLREITEIDDHLRGKGLKIYYGYVPTEENPADCGTRGLNKDQLANHFWWRGPPFLKDPPDSWLVSYKLFQMTKETDDTSLPPESALLNQTVSKAVESQYSDIFENLKRYPLPTIKRITAKVLRFIKNIVNRIRQRSKDSIHLSPLLEKYTGHKTEDLDGAEIAVAGKIIIRIHQQAFCSKTVLKSMPQLNIKQDEEGLMRCHGRMGKSCLNDAAKFPYIILQNSWLSEAIIRENHRRGHPGIGHTIALVRQKFWIPKLRAQVTRIIRRCIECQRFNNRPYKYPDQSDLPGARVQQTSPFQHVGLDYFGPLTIKGNEGNTSKCYGAIITCMVTRLVYLDVVTDLSTIAFLNMLRRFFGRRGVPKSITSDNAPTFLLGEEILTGTRNLHQEAAVVREISDREIEWKHITPFAPWQGGFYERLIRSVKHALYKTLRGSTPTFEEMSTTLVEIEALLNTRPLLYMSSDSCNETIIRPIDFLQNKITLNYPIEATTSDMDDPTYRSSEEQVALRTKLQTIQALESSCKSTDKFWSIWRAQYLTALREKHKLEVGHNKSRAIPRESDCVLITDPIQPRQSWRMGRIIKLVTGEDGEVREAVVILPSKKQIRRPVNLLVPLELEDRTAAETDVNKNQVQQENPQTRYNLRSRDRTDRNVGSNALHLQMSPYITLLVTILCMCRFSQQVLLLKAELSTSAKLPLALVKMHTTSYAFKTFKYIAQKQVTYYCSRSEFPTTLRSYTYTSPTDSVQKDKSNHTKNRFVRNKCSATSWNSTCTAHSTYKRSIFSMPLEELDEDIRCIAIITESRSKTELEEHIKLTKEAITRQIATAVSIEEDYEHLKQEQVFEGEPREQVVITGRLHLAAKVSKERYLALCARYSLLNKCYALSYLDQDESGYNIDESTLREMNAHVKGVDKLIRRIEKRHHIAEGSIRSSANRRDEADKRIIRILNDKLVERDREIFSLKATIASLTAVQQPAPATYNDFGCQVAPELSDAHSQTEAAEVSDVEQPPLAEEDNEMMDTCGEKDDSLMLLDEDSADEQMNDEEQMDDEHYLGHLIHKTEQGENENALRKDPEKEEEIKRKQEECKALLEDIDQLEQVLRVFPYRVYGEAPRGTHVFLLCAFCKALDQHYSDSCPQVRDGNERYERVRREQLCPRCLESCPPGRCQFRRRPCFYCEKLKGTIAARLMPRDSGHHKSLCTVPDEKETLRRWIEELKERYIGLRREIIAMKEDNAEARVSPKATFRG